MKHNHQKQRKTEEKQSEIKNESVSWRARKWGLRINSGFEFIGIFFYMQREIMDLIVGENWEFGV